MSVVGIDLGTTNSVVAMNREGGVHVLADENGDRLIPSIVSFHPGGEVLVGRAAKARRRIDPKNTIFSIKRLIGHTFSSPTIAEARARFPFDLREGPGGSPVVFARGQEFTLPEISAFVLRRIRQIATLAGGQNVDRAVITVPAHFNELQRASTKVAGRVAGLEVLRILNEPTAAALAYGLGRTGRERVAVYDFGGGTFDCTILDLNGSVYEVLATAGDSFLGGDDLDQAIAYRMAEDVLAKHRFDARSDPMSYERLRAAAEELKMLLSARAEATVQIPEVAYGVGGRSLDVSFGMSRRDFDALSTPFIDRTFAATQDALNVARLTPSSIDRVILVGGSTRIPLVRARVEAFFGKRALDELNPDEVVAIGAAIQASALTDRTRKQSIPAPPPLFTTDSNPALAPASSVAEPPTQARAASPQDAPGFGTIDEPPTMHSVTGSSVVATKISASAAPSAATLPNTPNPLPAAGRVAQQASASGSFGVVDDDIPSLISSVTDTGHGPDHAGPRSAPIPGFGEIDEGPQGTVNLPPQRRSAGTDPGVAPPSQGQAFAPVPLAQAQAKGAPPRGSVPTPGHAPAHVPGHGPAHAQRPPQPMTQPSPQFPAQAPVAAPQRPSGAPHAGSTAKWPQQPLHAAPPAQAPAGPSAHPPRQGSQPPPLPPHASAPAMPAPVTFSPNAPGMPGAPAVPLFNLAAPGPAGATQNLPAFGIARPLAPLPHASATAPLPAMQAGFGEIALQNAPAPMPGFAPMVPLQGQPVLVDVTPRALVVETAGGFCDALIPRNARIPCERSRQFATGRDGQTSVRVRVGQGESPRFAENTYLGEVELAGLRPAMRGEVKLQVTFILDEGGLLNVRARDLTSGQEARATLQLVGVAQDAQLQDMISRIAAAPVSGNVKAD
jgi:molecular chaperone DnaK